MPFTTLQQKIQHLLWETELERLPKWQSLNIRLLRIFQAVIKDLSEGMLTLRAMSLVYTTLLSIIPVLAVCFFILKGFGMHNQMEPVLLQALAPLGAQGETITKQIISFVDQIDVGLLGAMGIVFLFYTVISLIHKIERAFNNTWHITEYRSITQRISDYLSVIMIGPILIFTALAFTAAITSSTVINKLSSVKLFALIFETTGNLLPYLLVIIAFTAVYLLVPNTRVKFRSALLGAVIAGVLWQTTGWLFASFIASSGNYAAVYSSFAILIIFMVWLYLSWLILLIGAAIAYYHQHPDKMLAAQNNLILSSRMKEKIALLTMYHIGKSFHENLEPWSASDLSDVLNIPNECLSSILHTLESDRLITRHQDRDITYSPALSLENISVSRILETIRAQDESSRLNLDSINSINIVDKLADNLNKISIDATGSITLRDLITNNETNI